MSIELWQIISGVFLGISTGGVISCRFKSPAWITAFITAVLLVAKVWNLI